MLYEFDYSMLERAAQFVWLACMLEDVQELAISHGPGLQAALV
jgi:hypothetical protein